MVYNNFLIISINVGSSCELIQGEGLHARHLPRQNIFENVRLKLLSYVINHEALHIPVTVFQSF